MTQQLFWLAFRLGDDYTLSPYLAESRQEALRYGMEHVLNQELAGLFRDELGFTQHGEKVGHRLKILWLNTYSRS